MRVQQPKIRPGLVTLLCAIAVGVGACADSPTGVPYTGSDQHLHAAGDAGPQKICYLIDGQVYCVGGTLAAQDSTKPRP